MLGAGKLILEFCHFFFRAVEHAAQLVGHAKINIRTGDLRLAIQLPQQSIAQLIRLNTDFLEQWSRDAVALIEKRQKEMLIRDFLLVGLRSEVLRPLERFLHLLGEFVDPHRLKIANVVTGAIARR